MTRTNKHHSTVRAAAPKPGKRKAVQGVKKLKAGQPPPAAKKKKTVKKSPKAKSAKAKKPAQVVVNKADKKRAPSKKKPTSPQASRARGKSTPGPKPAAPITLEPIADERLLVPQRLCAIVFDVTPQAIQQWPVKPRVKKGREALYYLPDLSKFRDQQAERESGTTLNNERTRLAAAQADRVELEVGQLRGDLIPSEVILATWEPIIGAARAKVLAMASKLKTAIPKLTDKDLAKVKKISRGILEDLANSGIPKSARRNTRPSK